MRSFTATELSRMRDTQESAMQDQCIVQTFTDSADSHNQLIRTWADQPAIICGVDRTGGREVSKADSTVVFADVTIRLPIGTVIDPAYRIKLITRFGEPIDPVVYGIIGEVQRGPSGLVLNLQKIEPSGAAL